MLVFCRDFFVLFEFEPIVEVNFHLRNGFSVVPDASLIACAHPAWGALQAGEMKLKLEC